MITKFWNSYLPGTLWTIAIFILLILPGSSFPSKDWLSKIYVDKWVHLFLFGSFVFFWSLGNRFLTIGEQKKRLFKLFLTGIVFGVLMEVIQHFWVYSRSFELTDILADAAGCFVGWRFCYRKVNKLHK